MKITCPFCGFVTIIYGNGQNEEVREPCVNCHIAQAGTGEDTNETPSQLELHDPWK